MGLRTVRAGEIRAESKRLIIRLDGIGKPLQLAEGISYLIVSKGVFGIKLNHLLIGRERVCIPLLVGEDISLLFIYRGFRRDKLNSLFADCQCFVKSLKVNKRPGLSKRDIFIPGI